MANKPFNWKEHKDIELKIVELNKKSLNINEIIEELENSFGIKFTRDCIRHKVERLSSEEKPVNNKILVKRIKTLEAEKNKRESLVSTLCDYFDQIIPSIKVKPVKVAGSVKGKNDLQMHLLLSDLHGFSKIDPESTQGLGSYNLKIFEQRLNCLVEKIVLFKEEDKNSQGLNRLIVHGLGDYVESEGIFPSQAHSIEASATDQVVGVAERLSSMFLTLCKYFTEIEISSVTGNHGRIGGKNGGLHDNFSLDFLVMYITSLLLKNSGMSNIKTFVTHSPMLLSKRGRFIFLIEHGDAVSSYNSLPWYGMERRHMRLEELYKLSIDFHIMGHYHQAGEINAGQILVNGSLPGGSNLSINRMGTSALPMQKIFYFSDKHGINRTTNLILSEFPDLKPDKNGFLTPNKLL
jgi:hypothetical protein